VTIHEQEELVRNVAFFNENVAAGSVLDSHDLRQSGAILVGNIRQGSGGA
jgi:hypothetical protein